MSNVLQPISIAKRENRYRLAIRHVAAYRYSERVTFGRHRLMFRPRDTHSLRLLDASLSIQPAPQHIRWAYDTFGNSVAYAEFGDKQSDVLRIASEISLLVYGSARPAAMLLASAVRYPFSYAPIELPDLKPVLLLQRLDDDGQFESWSRQFVERGNGLTLSILSEVVETIRSEFKLCPREAPSAQDPVRTLFLKTGSATDIAVLMVEALRSLRFAARFVSGYTYSPNYGSDRLDDYTTHVWVQVYLPGCGWIDLDPTNDATGNRDLIPVAVVRDHTQAPLLSGSYVGPSAACIGKTSKVSVTRSADIDH